MPKPSKSINTVAQVHCTPRVRRASADDMRGNSFMNLRSGLRAGVCCALALSASALGAEVSQPEAGAREAAASLRYVPAIPSELKPEWDAWVKEAGSVIEVVGAGAQSRADPRDIAYEAMRAGTDPVLVFALVEVLSAFDEHASSGKAIGLMALPLSVHVQLGRKENTLYLGKYNLRLGCSLLRIAINQRKGDLTAAVTQFLQRTGNEASLETVRRVYEAREKRLGSLRPRPP